MKKNDIGIPIVTRKELQLIKDRMDQKGSTKGLVIMGKPGTGKTTLVRKWLDPGELRQGPDETDYRFNLRKSAQPKGKLITSNDIVAHYMTEGKIMYNTVHIDDLGTEPIANHFGTSLDVIPFIIQRQYEYHQKYICDGLRYQRCFGWYTTNLNYEELNERYGERVMDRFRETCYFLILEDTSFRKLTTAEQINEDLQ